MKEIFGFAVLIIVFLVSLAAAANYWSSAQGRFLSKLFTISLLFIGLFLGIYAVIAVIGCIIWGVAWVGIFLREILQWLVEAMLSPITWLWK